jgi:hypothetical protein
MSGSYQRVECNECRFNHESQTALMLGKKHANDTGHTVFWLQEHTGTFTPEGGDSA